MLSGDYVLSQTPGGKETQKRFPTHFQDYPGKPSFFDVYSPTIRSLYSQVFWKALPPVDLPKEIVQQFDGKGMAVVGFEMDQVRRTKDGDVSVPITVAYNHHFESTMVGKRAAFENALMQGPGDPRIPQKHGHGASSAWKPGKHEWVVRERVPGELPSSQSFGGANGGEYRKSFHGYAPSFVQVIESPTQIQITPMQIDTWNRDKMNISHPTRFVPGPVPRSSLAPTSGRDALYSGLLECPVTTRILKHALWHEDGLALGIWMVVLGVPGEAVVRLGGKKCERSPASGEECLALAESALFDERRRFLLDSSAPTVTGCFASADSEDLNLVRVHFKADRRHGGRSALDLRQDLRGKAGLCGADAQKFVGASSPLVNVSVVLDLTKQQARISLAGPSSAWFGVGFNAVAMADQPWSLIVDGSGAVTERKLGDHQPGQLLKPSIVVEESKVVGNLRTVTVTRALKGASADYYSFSPFTDGSGELNFICAVGSTPNLSYHSQRTPGRLSFLPLGGSEGACICRGEPVPFGQAKGTLEYRPTAQPEDQGTGSVGFNNRCAAQPRSDLLAMQNPTCDLRNYSGGQLACHHMWSLLDADQAIPWPDQPLEYSLKFRFWVEDYNKSYHTSLRRVTWGIASPVEYDVPKCAEGVMGCSKDDRGNWIHTIKGTFTGGGSLSAAHFHCHAPTCLSMALYRCPKETKVCDQSTGELLCMERPVYGNGSSSDRFAELGYILQPPCLWGSEEFGLEPPPSVEGFVLGAIKTSNATYGHHGEMAWHQMYVFDAPTDTELV
ncbi:unnamed protein product [Symbiodinium pilosum]|uniref:Uncharacterized protein n=1 Tax=Symbiodinium pilosum TaxID=2952 RepID=A0A812S9I7_SYMPI|nr:unnamed protein product [Symbiodinium pilosum]